MVNSVESKGDEKKLKFDKAVFIYAYIILLLPVILFFLFWTKLYIGITVSVFACAGFYFILKAKRKTKNIFGDNYKKKLIMTLLVAFIWTLLSGQGGLFYQNNDFHMRNAVFHDLVKYDWPVIFNIPANIEEGLTQDSNAYQNALLFGGKDAVIVYYLGFWLPPAIISKAFNFMGGSVTILADWVLFLWTFSAVFTVLYMLIRALKKFSYKILFIFVFFSGMDIIMSTFFYVTGLEGLLFLEGRLVPHLDSWTMQQYTSNTSALYWVFNQAVPLWIFCGILLNEKNLKYIFLPYSCLVLSSTLPMIGALPLIIFFIVHRHKKMLEKQGKKADIKTLSKEALRFINIVNISAIPILILSYLYIASSPTHSAITFMSGSPDFVKLLVIIGSLLIETALIIFILFHSGKEHKGLLITVTVLLFIIPFINIGARYDFTMRASLPALFFLCYLCCYVFLHVNVKHVKRLLAIVLIIGSFTAVAEITQPVLYVFTGQPPKANAIESLADITNPEYQPRYCLGLTDSFFMQHILRKH